MTKTTELDDAAALRVVEGTRSPTVDRIQRLAPARGTLVVVDVAGDGDWADTVERTSRSLLEQCRRLPPGAITFVARVAHGQPTVVQAAATAAVKGVVGVAALEVAPRGQRVNTVVISDTTVDSDIRAALTYLADDKGAGFTAGATVDLTHPGHGPAPVPELPVLVTGASGGLGGAVATAFVEAGRRVVISDLDSDALSRQAERLDVPAIACDVTSHHQVRALAEDPLLVDGLSSLQLIHGVGGSGSLETLDAAVRERSLRVNGTGVWNLVEALTPAVRVGNGSIVVLSSQAGLISEAGNGAYCAAKFASVALVRALVGEVDLGVRVHCICPGPIETPLMRDAFTGMAEQAGVTYDEYHAQREAEIPLGRFGQPEHIGSAALLLANLRATGVLLAPTGALLLT